MIQVEILNRLSVHTSAGDTVPLSPTLHDLILILALRDPRSDQPWTRLEIADLLWRTGTPDAKSQRLRQALTDARKTLGKDFFDTSSSSLLTINPETVRVDAWEVRAALREDPVRGALQHPLPKLPPLRRPRLRSAKAADSLEDWVDETLALTPSDKPASTPSPRGLSTLNRDWSTAQTGEIAIEWLVFRARSDAPFLTGLVSEVSARRTLAILQASAQRVLEVGNNLAIVELSGPDIARRLYSRLSELPGAAGADAERVETVSTWFGTHQHTRYSEEVVQGLADLLEAVLWEQPLVLVLEIGSTSSDDFHALASILSATSDLTGLTLVITGVGAWDFASLPPALTRALPSRVVQIQEQAPGRPDNLPASPTPPKSPRTTYAGALAVTAIAAALGLTTLLPAPDPANEPAALRAADLEVLFCASGEGPAGFLYSWLSRSDRLERLAEYAGGCPTLVEIRSDSIVVATGGTPAEPLLQAQWAPYHSEVLDLEPSRVVIAPPEGARAVGRALSPGGEVVWLVRPNLIFNPVDGDWARMTSMGDSLVWVRTSLRAAATGGQALATPLHDDFESYYLVDLERDSIRSATLGRLGDGSLQGSLLYFSEGNRGDEENGSLEIWLKDLDSGFTTPLTENSWNDYEIALSDDGRFLCWQDEEFGHFASQIRVLDTQTRESWTVGLPGARNSRCAFASSGDWIVHEVIEVGGRRHLRLVSVNGSSATIFSQTLPEPERAVLLIRERVGRQPT